jgi:four helix bundle protein
MPPATPPRVQSTASFKDLEVWRESMALVEDVYAATKAFPRGEQYGLSSQLRRASVSIASNIGEGCRRKRRKATLNHLDIALGSQGEVEVQLELAMRLKFGRPDQISKAVERAARVGRMLNGLITSLQPRPDDWTEG